MMLTASDISQCILVTLSPSPACSLLLHSPVDVCSSLCPMLQTSSDLYTADAGKFSAHAAAVQHMASRVYSGLPAARQKSCRQAAVCEKGLQLLCSPRAAVHAPMRR